MAMYVRYTLICMGAWQVFVHVHLLVVWWDKSLNIITNIADQYLKFDKSSIMENEDIGCAHQAPMCMGATYTGIHTIFLHI